MAEDPFHERLLKIVKRLPETVEDWPWGSIHCKVADKIFVGWGRDESGEMSIGIRTTLELQSMLVASDPRFSVAKYVGKYGGIDMRIGKKPNWDEVEQLIVDSYRIIAPKRLVKQLDAQLGGGAAPKVAPAKKTAAKKTAAKKIAAKR
jgi:predicted DNA-binding protein (MmcQ/YjbR family)